ncbi:MAG: hypothetical protein EOL98_12095, partial [Negativicutes bacterium]|nr:hypothetical protein [Negativicutes bacterium]
MIVGINSGIAGLQAIISVNDNHIFADAATRDSYFTTKPEEKVVNTFISVGTGFQQWDGAAWFDKTAVLRGETGGYGFTNGKGWLPAYAMLPELNSSAYYLEDVTPAQIFSATEDQMIRAIINSDELPSGTTTIRFRIEARHADSTSPVSRDVVWKVRAGFYNNNWRVGTLGTAVSVTQTLDINDDKTAISTQSSAITIAGT